MKIKMLFKYNSLKDLSFKLFLWWIGMDKMKMFNVLAEYIATWNGMIVYKLVGTLH